MEAPNWMAALGLGLQELGLMQDMSRIACESLPNGTVIVRNISTGQGFVVNEVDGMSPPPEPPDLIGAPVRTRIDAVREAVTRQIACQLALELAQEFVPGESASVLLLNGEFLEFMAVSGPKASKLKGATIPVNAGVVGVCFERQQPIVVANTDRSNAHYKELDEQTGYTTRQIACVPIRYEGEKLGVLEMINPPRGHEFGRVYLESLEAVADLLAVRLMQPGR